MIGNKHDIGWGTILVSGTRVSYGSGTGHKGIGVHVQKVGVGVLQVFYGARELGHCVTGLNDGGVSFSKIALVRVAYIRSDLRNDYFASSNSDEGTFSFGSYSSLISRSCVAGVPFLGYS